MVVASCSRLKKATALVLDEKRSAACWAVYCVVKKVGL